MRPYEFADMSRSLHAGSHEIKVSKGAHPPGTRIFEIETHRADGGNLVRPLHQEESSWAKAQAILPATLVGHCSVPSPNLLRGYETVGKLGEPRLPSKAKRKSVSGYRVTKEGYFLT